MNVIFWRGSDQIDTSPRRREHSVLWVSSPSICHSALLSFSPFPSLSPSLAYLLFPLLLLFDKRKQRGQTEGRRAITSNKFLSSLRIRDPGGTPCQALIDPTLGLKASCWESTLRICTSLPCRSHLLNLVYKNSETSGLNSRLRENKEWYTYIFLSRAWDIWIARLPLPITLSSPQFPCVIYFPGCLGGRNRSWTLETHGSQPLVSL